MPASGKMLKNKAQRENRLAGIGDEQGRLPSRVKPAAVMMICTLCQTEIRETKTNTEAKTHCESKHPTSTFAVCFPGTHDPTAATPPAAAIDSSLQPKSASTTAEAPKKAPKNDLSFLDASVALPNVQKKVGKK